MLLLQVLDTLVKREKMSAWKFSFQNTYLAYSCKW